MSPSTVSVSSILRRAGKGYSGDLKSLALVALVESTAFALISLAVEGAVEVGGSNLFLVQSAGLSLSAGAWILSAFAAAEVGIHEQGSAETESQRVRRRLGALLGVTLIVNALALGLTLAFLWLLPSAVDDGDAGWGLVQLMILFLFVLSILTLITNLAVSALMVEDCSARAAWSSALDLLPMEGTPRLAVVSLIVLVLPVVIGIGVGALIHSVTGAPDAASEFVGGVASETILGPFVAAFIVGAYVTLRDKQAAEAEATQVVVPSSAS